MPRVRLDYPDQVFTFTTETDIRFSDVNLGGHLGNDALVSLIGDARSRYFAELGRTEGGPEGVVVADLMVSYRAEGFLRDRLRIDVGVAERARASVDLAYRVVRPADDTVLAIAKTGLVFFNYTTRSVIPVPADFPHPPTD